MVIAYRLNPVSFAIAIACCRLPHVGLVNLIAGREVSPELLQSAVTPTALAHAVLPLLDPRQRRRSSPAGGIGARAAAAGGTRALTAWLRSPWSCGVKLGAAGCTVRLLAATWRYRVEGWEHVAAASRERAGHVIYVLWHRSYSFRCCTHRRDEGVALLISRIATGATWRAVERWAIAWCAAPRNAERGRSASGWCATCAREGNRPQRRRSARAASG